MRFIYRFVLAYIMTAIPVLFGFILFMIASSYDNRLATGIYFANGGMYFLCAGIFSTMYIIIEYFEQVSNR